MKKSGIAVIAGAAAVVTIAAAVSVSIISAHLNPDKSPTPKVSTASESTESSVPTEKDTIRSRIRQELTERKDELHKEMTAKGKDARDVSFDADAQAGLEQANNAVAVLKKYGRLEDDFTLENVDDNVKAMKAACGLLNGTESITTEERAILEIYLEENYYALPDLEGQEDLMKEISDTVSLPF